MFGRELIFLLLVVTITSAEFDLAARAPRREHDVHDSDGPSKRIPFHMMEYRRYGLSDPIVKETRGLLESNYKY